MARSKMITIVKNNNLTSELVQSKDYKYMWAYRLPIQCYNVYREFVRWVL